MTLKQIFQKIEAYNEVAELMQTQKARIYFTEITVASWGEHFTDYNALRKYIRETYIKPVADAIIASNEWEFDKEVYINCGEDISGKYMANLVA